MARHDSFGARAGWQPETGTTSWAGSGAVVRDSYLMRGYQTCQPGIAYRGNVYTPFSRTTGVEACDPSELLVPFGGDFGYRDGGTGPGFDYTPAGASPGAGRAGVCDGETIDGTPRSSPCGVGAGR